MKKHRKVIFVTFQRRFISSNFAAGALELMRAGQNLWHKSPLKNDKAHFLVFFPNKRSFYIKAKLTVSKSLSSMWCYFFWFDTFEGMSFFQQYFLAKGGGLGFWWLAFPIHFWSYFHAPYTFLASHSKKFKCLFSPQWRRNWFESSFYLASFLTNL